jgi:RNA polymerase sigma-70 factor (ECF subfamily)
VTDRAASPQSPPVSSASTAPAAPAPTVTPPDFRAAYQANFSYVYNSLRRLGVRDADLEDLAHDVFVAFYRGLSAYDPARPLRPWLFGIAFRIASDYRRRAAHRLEISKETHDLPDSTPSADAHVAASEARRAVLAALSTLDLDRRAVFVLHDLDGQPMPEIARALAVPLNTAYSRLRLAREQFAAAVRSQHRREEP